MSHCCCDRGSPIPVEAEVRPEGRRESSPHPCVGDPRRRSRCRPAHRSCCPRESWSALGSAHHACLGRSSLRPMPKLTALSRRDGAPEAPRPRSLSQPVCCYRGERTAPHSGDRASGLPSPAAGSPCDKGREDRQLAALRQRQIEPLDRHPRSVDGGGTWDRGVPDTAGACPEAGTPRYQPRARLMTLGSRR